MEIVISENKFYDLVKKAVKEAIQDEMIEIFLKSLPSVSEREMNDIDKLYDKPSNEKEIAFSEVIEVWSGH